MEVGSVEYSDNFTPGVKENMRNDGNINGRGYPWTPSEPLQDRT